MMRGKHEMINEVATGRRKSWKFKRLGLTCSVLILTSSVTFSEPSSFWVYFFKFKVKGRDKKRGNLSELSKACVQLD